MVLPWKFCLLQTKFSFNHTMLSPNWMKIGNTHTHTYSFPLCESKSFINLSKYEHSFLSLLKESVRSLFHLFLLLPSAVDHPQPTTFVIIIKFPPVVTLLVPFSFCNWVSRKQTIVHCYHMAFSWYSLCHCGWPLVSICIMVHLSTSSTSPPLLFYPVVSYITETCSAFNYLILQMTKWASLFLCA